MSSIKFDNCSFSNCNIHVGDNNINGSSSGSSGNVSDAIALGGLLLGGAMFLPTLASTVIPMCILGVKGALIGTMVCSGSKVVKMLASGRKDLNQPMLDVPKDTLNFIEVEPLKIYDSEE